MKGQDNFEVMSNVFLSYSVCNRYMRKYVANIKLMHYVNIEYKTGSLYEVKINMRVTSATNATLAHGRRYFDETFLTSFHHFLNASHQSQIPGDSRRSIVAVLHMLCNPTFLRFYSLFLLQMNEFKRDDPSTNILFVQTVQKYPCLYNYKMSEYSRRDLTEDAWMNVAQEMNFTGNYNSVTN